MDTHQRIARHHGLTERTFANARPAHLARAIAQQVERDQDANAASALDRRLFFPPPSSGGGGGGGGSTGGTGGGTGGGGGGGGGGHNGGDSHSHSSHGDPRGNPSNDSGSTGSDFPFPGLGGNGNGNPGAGTGTGGAGGGNGGGGNTGGGGGDGGDGEGVSRPPPDDTATRATRTPSSTKTPDLQMPDTTTSSTVTKVALSTRTASLSLVTPTVTQPSGSFVAPDPATVVQQVASTTDASLASQTADASAKPSGPGAGLVIGIVAGALAGAAVLFVVVGFLWRKFARKEDPYEANPFDRDEFRRHSAMLPEHFDEDDLGPSMSEHHNFSPNPYNEEAAGMAGAGIMAASGGAAGMAIAREDSNSHGPRPPTMFQRHINGQMDYSAAADMPPVPQVGGVYDAGYPALPPMAFGGGDPYGAAGVSPMANVANPYAHLDRASGTLDQQQQQQQHELGRSGSNGSNSGYGSAHDYNNMHPQGHGDFDTAGRPDTAEGRSGTPDIPNVQQRYAGVDGNEDTLRLPQFNSPAAEPLRNPFDHSMDGAAAAAGYHHQQGSVGSNNSYSTPYSQHANGALHGAGADLHAQPSLSVRNLMPGGAHAQQQQRPTSMASEGVDPDDAYGGVY